MSDEEAKDRIISRFMLNTTRLPLASDVVVQAFVDSTMLNLMSGNVLNDSESVKLDASITGSVAEFYIEPMLPCIGDIDMMYFPAAQLAIPFGYPPPTVLPSNFYHSVTVLEIIDSRMPGYVNLELRYTLEKNENGNYRVVDTFNRESPLASIGLLPHPNSLLDELHADSNPLELFNAMTSRSQAYANDIIEQQALRNLSSIINSGVGLQASARASGPAHRIEFDYRPTADDSVPVLGQWPGFKGDNVFATRCLVWPPQAADWPTRHRKYGWPDSATINRVFNNGCDVVPVAHRQCRSVEWENVRQWRLSFSRAEVVLLNSWTPVQQIVYHMLRFVIKHEHFTDCHATLLEDKALKNYHIKTLMLWSCELKPQSWWNGDYLVRCSCDLLETLAAWIVTEKCQHYFINNANLFDSDLHFAETSSHISALSTRSMLSVWFIKNYLRKCALRCPSWVSILFDDIGTNVKLQTATDAFAIWKASKLPSQIYEELLFAEEIPFVIHQSCSLTVRSYRTYEEGFRNLYISQLLSDCFPAFVCLHIAYKTASRNELSEELLDVLWTMFHPDVGNGFDYLEKALYLLKLNHRCKGCERGTVEKYMAKAYLYKTLKCEQQDNHTVCYLTHLLLATLCYNDSQHPSALEHCFQIVTSGSKTDYWLHSIDGNVFSQNVTISAVLGITTLYRHVRSYTLPGTTKVSNKLTGLTTDLLAYWLRTKLTDKSIRSNLQTGMRAATISNKLMLYRHRLCDYVRLHIGDVLLFKELHRNISGVGYKRRQVPNPRKESHATNCNELAVSLQELALNKLVMHRQKSIEYICSVHGARMTMNEYAILQMYRRGLFTQCLLHSLTCLELDSELASVGRRISMLYPEFLQLIDGELVSLAGVVRILSPKQCMSPLFLPCDISHYTLLLYLMAQCLLRLEPSDSDVVNICCTLKEIYFVFTDPMLAKVNNELDRLTLALIYRRLKLHLLYILRCRY